jgi:LPS sulfotransferase NodH
MNPISYFICTNPRSGSWLLAEGLTSTGVAGQPREWFQDEEQRERSAEWGIDPASPDAPARYLSRVLTEATTPNGCFGAKVMYYQFPSLPQKLQRAGDTSGAPVAELLARTFPGIKFVWLRRRDSARQAISYYRAVQTDQWWAIEGAQRLKRPGTTDAPEFDAEAIARLEAEIVKFDRAWQTWFAENQITPFTVFYEDLADDYTRTIASVLEWLGVTGSESPAISPPRLKKQADELTEQWLRRYAATKSAPTTAPSRPALEVSIYQLAGDELFKAHRPDGTGWDWSPAPPQRDWMDATQQKFAYRCLPLTIANQTGWWFRNPVDFTATWHGESVEFAFDSEPEIWSPLINDQFGHGIITWNTPLLFRTRPAGSRLLVCGPVNHFKHGVQPMTAIIESDWATSSFTMNWKITAANTTVRFKAGEPLFQIVPISVNPCAEFEGSSVSYKKLADDPEVAAAYAAWSASRTRFHTMKESGEIKSDQWQKDYFRGESGAEKAAGHTTKVVPPKVKYGSS